MRTETTAEDQRMAKKQRSIQLPEDIFNLTDAVEKQTGARFNRQLLAAILQWVFTNAYGPEGSWMELAVEIEQGRCSVGDVPKKRLEQLKSEIGASDGAEEDWLTQQHDDFEDMLNRPEPNPIDRIINHWSEQRKH